MNSKDYHHLASSAIRIYLTYEQHQTENLVRSYQLRERIAHFPEQRSDWRGTVSATQRVITYIKNCKSDEGQLGFFARAFHGLSAIGAAQEALANWLSHVQNRHLGCETRCMYFQCISQEHELRAKCIVNSLVSINHQDQELAVLWEQAAAHILFQCQIRRKESQEMPLAAQCMTELCSLSNIYRTERYTGAVVSAEVRKLDAKALRTSQLSAVHKILGTENDYYYATSNYTLAADYIKRAQCATSVVAQLWRLAASALQLAGEVVEAQALLRTSADDPTHINLQLEAAYFKQCAIDVERLSHWKRDVVGNHSKAESQDTFRMSEATAPLRTVLLATSQEKALLMWENYTQCLMQGLSSKSEADELSRLFYSARDNMLQLERKVRELETSVESAAFYTRQITQSAHVANECLRVLWRQCWTRAAELTTTEIQQCNEVVVDGEFRTHIPPESQRARKLCKLKAQLYVNYAVGELNTADEYFRAACGAQASKNRDSREIEWWRCASNLQTTAVEKFVSCIEEIVDVSQGEELCLQLVNKAVEESRRGADTYATAADYMRRAHHLRATHGHLEYAHCVAELFTLLAEVLVQRISNDDAVYFNRAQMFCLLMVDVKTGVKKDQPMEVVALLERSCQYTRQWINALTAGSQQAISWRSALGGCFEAYGASNTGWNEQASMAVLTAAIYAKQAEAQLNDVDYYVYQCAAGIMDKAPQKCATGSKDVANHLAELAARVCRLSSLGTPVPEELLLFVQDVPVDARVQPILRDCLETCQRKVECCSAYTQIGVDGAKQKLLSYAHGELNYLLQDYTLQLQYTIHPDEKGKHINDQHLMHLLGTRALHKVCAKCYMAAAESDSRVWDAALAMCGDAKGTNRETEAAQAIERYVSAAEAAVREDHELAELYLSAACEARQLWEKLKTSRTDERVFYDYKLGAADQLVLALLAQRRGQVVVSEVHAQIAKLSDQVCSLSYRLIDRTKRQSVIVNISKLQDRVDNLCYLESKRAVHTEAETTAHRSTVDNSSVLMSTTARTRQPRISSSLRASVATRKLKTIGNATAKKGGLLPHLPAH